MAKVLFVCMGNICRSPAAEGIFKKFVEDSKLSNIISIGSAGTIGYHSEEMPDERMRKHALIRGYNLDTRARQFNPNRDFDGFDYIITMDNDNYTDILRMDNKNIYNKKVLKIADFISDKNITEVPDPYYGTANEFEFVIDILEDGIKKLLIKIIEDLERKS